jgi:hypothetical protein
MHLCWSCTGSGLNPTTSTPGVGSPLPHLHRDWAHPCHICTGTERSPAHICTETEPTPAAGERVRAHNWKRALGPKSGPLPRRDQQVRRLLWSCSASTAFSDLCSCLAWQCHICTGTGRTPATSASLAAGACCSAFAPRLALAIGAGLVGPLVALLVRSPFLYPLVAIRAAALLMHPLPTCATPTIVATVTAAASHGRSTGEAERGPFGALAHFSWNDSPAANFHRSPATSLALRGCACTPFA